jgi:hypothetical protein
MEVMAMGKILSSCSAASDRALYRNFSRHLDRQLLSDVIPSLPSQWCPGFCNASRRYLRYVLSLADLVRDGAIRGVDPDQTHITHPLVDVMRIPCRPSVGDVPFTTTHSAN